MIASIRHTATAESLLPAARPLGPMRQASRDLTAALKSDDLPAARHAYAEMVKAMPEGASMQAGTPFAQLGKALVKGDMEAARTAYADIFKSRLPTAQVPPTPAPATPSSTGGTSGTVLNAVA